MMRMLFSKPSLRRLRPALFFDRDGVINERIVGGYVECWDQFHFMRGIHKVLADLSQLGLPIIVISNQAGVGKGLVRRPALRDMTKQFVAGLRARGARLDAVYYCPHAAEANCRCRKPRPGLLRQAARDWRIDLEHSVLVGDSWRDVEAARAVGSRAILLVGRGQGAESKGQAFGDDRVARIRRIPEIAEALRDFLEKPGKQAQCYTVCANRIE